MDTLISFQNVCKCFQRNGNDVLALQNINLEVKKGEFLVVIGPSGCGKSTLLNMIAGLMKPTQGVIYYGDQQVVSINTKVGYMTQKDNLLPWRDVEGNIGISLEIKGLSASERKAVVQKYIELVGLTGFENHYPNELSGGMRKRVCLARVLAYNPETLLMDEPFGALDAQLRLVLQGELLRIQREMKKTIIFITHDLDEAVTLGDRVVVLSSRPGTIRTVKKISFPEPRNVFQLRYTEKFGQYHGELWELLSEDIRKGEKVV